MVNEKVSIVELTIRFADAVHEMRKDLQSPIEVDGKAGYFVPIDQMEEIVILHDAINQYTQLVQVTQQQQHHGVFLSEQVLQ